MGKLEQNLHIEVIDHKFYYEVVRVRGVCKPCIKQGGTEKPYE